MYVDHRPSIPNHQTLAPRAGYISLDEFAEACELLKKHLPEHDTKEQLLEMCKMMDINKDGLVDLNEFLETFRLCEQTKGNYGKPDLRTLSGNGASASGSRRRSPLSAQRRLNGLGSSGVQKQSTEDDDESLLLDCGDVEPKTGGRPTTNGGVTNV